MEEIKSHPFFEGVDWENIRDESPPFLPIAQTSKSIYTREADEALHLEILELIKDKKSERPSSLRVSNFVNFEFLKNETLDSAERNLEEKNRKIRRMKTYVHEQENRRESRQRKRASIEVVSFNLPDDL